MARFVDVFKVFTYWKNQKEDDLSSLSPPRDLDIKEILKANISQKENSYNYFGEYVSLKERIEESIDSIKEVVVSKLKEIRMYKFHIFSVGVDICDSRLEDFLLTIDINGKVNITTEVFDRTNYQNVLNILEGEDLDPDGTLMDWRGFSADNRKEPDEFDYEFELEEAIQGIKNEILNLAFNQ